MQPYRVWLFSDLIEKNKRVFKVPVYQRNYDWSNVQCEKLYQDIMLAHKRDHKHFTGTIVYIVGLNGSNLSEVLIIDGQQRLTTVYILLKALYDAAKGVSVRIEEEIQEVMFNRNCDEKYKVKLKPIKSDNEQLLLLIKDKMDDMDRNSNIYKNYILFKSMIKETVDAGYELGDILDGIKKLEMVEIILDKSQGDEPQKIFESINSTGLDLSLADLIRNYLLMDDENQDELYEDYWSEIEKNVGYRNLGDFVINFLNSNITKAVNANNAYLLFKEHCEQNHLSHEDVLKKLKRTSRYYGAFVGENHYYSKEITGYLRSFDTIKQTTVLPLIFRIFTDYEDGHIDDKTLCKVLNYLLTYYVRVTACEINKNLSKFMKSMYDRVIDGTTYDGYYERFVVFLNGLKASGRMPSDEEFEYALLYKPLYKKPICKFVLSAIENSTKEHIEVSNLTIEHILPQKENAAVWKKEVGENYSRVYEVYLHTLGNLTITGHNSELGTKSFRDKKEIIRANSKAVILNREVLSADTWNEDAILHRAKVLAARLIEEFNYEDIRSDFMGDSDSGFSLDSGLNLTNTKPSSFSFSGEYTKVTSWAEVLTKFMTVAYDLNTALLSDLAAKDYMIPNATNVYITNDKRKLRKGKEIDRSGIYYESNLSANTTISFIRDMMVQMDLESEEFTFTLSEVPFDINDENTWAEGMLSVASLFYNFMADLIDRGLLGETEVEKLKTKEYTKSLFATTAYPAIADKRTENMGNSTQKRYRAKALSFQGTDIYISTQFYESDRDAVIEWYKRHLAKDQ
ncbi:hypothetical protein B5E84_15080 [Lachnoclostridium sp. An14]|uniref:DUF262 domain-containing protein n=1 Tax=Lachnoclostridium sp. An14 TaxID=1965562 RepID=UPI000B38BC0D|nr:DUF262 domain-containing protein [Lachnoclostridium sp. An14]OUQ15417.1 hypothetical protein B5E84_15080 [Lachnoclostridium sp. An14]